MKKLNTIILITGFVLISCNEKQIFEENTQQLEGTWECNGYYSEKEGLSDTDIKFSGKPIILSFNNPDDPGSFIAYTHSNKLKGKYEIGNKNKLHIDHVEEATKPEPTWGNRILYALSHANAYHLDEDHLKIYCRTDKRRNQHPEQTW